MARPTHTPTRAQRTRTSFTRSRITASIRISSDWLHFATRMNADTRAVPPLRSGETILATHFSFRATYTTVCFIWWAAGLRITACLGLPALRVLRLPGKWRMSEQEKSSPALNCAPASGRGIKEPAVFDQLDSLYPLLASLPGGSQLNLAISRVRDWSREFKNVRRRRGPVAARWPQPGEPDTLS